MQPVALLLKGELLEEVKLVSDLFPGRHTFESVIDHLSLQTRHKNNPLKVLRGAEDL